jgi:hypothetical protein
MSDYKTIDLKSLSSTYLYEDGEIFIKRKVGHLNSKGYKMVMIGRSYYSSHRIVWALCHGEWPNGIIDHIDGNRQNNRIENLRIVTASQNQRNRTVHRNGKLYGTSRIPASGRWRSKVTVNGKSIHLGMFATQKQAHENSVKWLRENGHLEKTD